MEELQVIETTSGRQFKPWATKDDVQDPASVTAIASEIASGKQAIAAAINAKGGTASATESFAELAKAVENIDWNPNSGVTWQGDAPKSVLQILSRLTDLTEIDSDEVIDTLPDSGLCTCTSLRSVKANIKHIGSNQFIRATLLEEVDLPITESVGAYFLSGSSSDPIIPVRRVNLPAFNGSIPVYFAHRCASLEYLNIINWNGVLASTTYNIAGGRLMTVVSGVNWNNNVNMKFWTAINVISSINNPILNENIRTYIIANMADRSQEGTHYTITLASSLYNILEQETIDGFVNKGWNLASV